MHNLSYSYSSLNLEFWLKRTILVFYFFNEFFVLKAEFSKIMQFYKNHSNRAYLSIFGGIILQFFFIFHLLFSNFAKTYLILLISKEKIKNSTTARGKNNSIWFKVSNNRHHLWLVLLYTCMNWVYSLKEARLRSVAHGMILHRCVLLCCCLCIVYV